MKQFVLALLVFLGVLSCACSGRSSQTKNTETKALVKAPDFNADNAYDFIQKQIDFGPRVPNTKAHRKAKAWLQGTLESFGARVYMQDFEDYVFDGTKVSLTNIIGSYNPEQKKRILLAAHWDTRPFADHDTENPMGSLDGANDGASGVGVLLEVARVINEKAPDVGVDIIFFDGEDWGDGDGEAPSPTGGKESWWCLGSQYWSKNKHIPNYSAYYGILLDMVGASNATFYYDGVSQQNAASVMKKVWNRAATLGHEAYFIPKLGFSSGIMDDHVFLNKTARIPTIDIIDFRPPNSFTPVWHTTKDDMDGIDKATLKVVGEVVLSMLYNE